MNKKDKIRLYGARYNRFGMRFFAFIGMLAFYSLVMGVKNEDEGKFLYEFVVLVGLFGLMIFGWFKGRKKREIDRSHQLSAEVSVLYPSVSSEEKKKLYMLRRRREMRLEALLYLFLAVVAAIWFWGMYAVNALPFSWILGLWVILPGLLLIAAALLLLSVLPYRKDKPVPDVSNQELQDAMAGMKLWNMQTDTGEYIVDSLSLAETAITPEEHLRIERKEAVSSALFAGFASFFFIGLPLILFGLDIYAVYIGKAPKWSLLMFGIIAFAASSLWLYVLHHSKKDSFVSQFRSCLHIRSPKCSAFSDSIQSYEQEGNSVRIVFSKVGAVRCPLQPETFVRCFAVPKQEAIILMFKDRIESVTLLRSRDEILPDADFSDESAMKDDILLSDEALHQAVMKRIESMPSSCRKEIEAEINFGLDQSEMIRKKDLLERTSKETSKLISIDTVRMRRTNADFELKVIESAVMEALNATRKDIMHMKKNPFMPALKKKLLVAAVIGIGGIVGTAAVEKWTGSSLGFVYLVFSSFSGVLALSCAQQIINVMRFRKLQKAYKDPEYRQKVLDAAVYKELLEQEENRRGNNKR